MKKKGLIFLLLLIVAIFADVTSESVLKNGYVERDDIYGEEKTLQLQLDIGEIEENYPYSLEVIPVAPTQTEAETYFEEAIAEIEADFMEVKGDVPMRTEYMSGIVEADWSFQPYGLVSSEGKVYTEKLEKENIIQAQVELSCGAYERIYTFSFLLEAPKMSTKEQVLMQVKDQLKQEMEKEGSSKVQLPTEVEGIPLKWSEKREFVTPKIILLEALVLLWVASKRKEKEDEKKRLTEMERNYADIVSQLSLLLGAGMTIRQAWNRIASQYRFKRSTEMIDPNPVYESILRMNRRFMEGESERAVYQQFVDEIPAPCYHKLMRILLGNLEKGTQGICIRLEEESRQAFEKRILLAKKLGEEASTKMLVPLMIMLMIVMGMVMVPALLGFQV